MSSNESAPEEKGKPPPSPHEPPTRSQSTQTTNQPIKTSIPRLLRQKQREKLLARGIQPPPSPPPTSPPTLHPFGQALLSAGGETIHHRYSRWVIKHACGTRVTKFPRDGVVRPSEVEALRFLAQHTTVPVPRVYEVGEGWFTMEYIPGETVRKAWEGGGVGGLSVEDRGLVVRQMRGYIEQLRGVKSPDGGICSFGGREVLDYRDMPVRGGPFVDEAAYNEFLVSELIGQTAVREMVRGLMRADHEVVLTHGHLHPRSIMVRPGVGVVGIVGWENVGYYPEYLEFVAMFRGIDSRCGYYGELLNVFPQRYDAEFAVDQVITRWDTNAVGCCGR